jgi:ABC-2 type transport system ATP-binding protein
LEPALLSIQGLVVDLGRTRALDGLDLDVQAGCVYALLGGNGAGKTTTLNALLGFSPATGGHAHVDGISCLSHPREARRRIAYLPENVSLYPYMSGLENLRYFCAVGGLSLDVEQARQALVEAGLPPSSFDRRVSQYSKGMRQKVGLAIAYAKQAKVLLLDEPTSGLDPGSAHELTRRLRCAAAAGMAVLMVTHDLFNARQAADRIGILRQGRKVAEVAAHELGDGALEQLYLTQALA